LGLGVFWLEGFAAPFDAFRTFLVLLSLNPYQIPKIKIILSS
jgi:hypothetical protein